MFWVALAGPAANIFLALVGCFALVASSLFLRHTAYFSGILKLLEAFVGVNLFLAFFNLIPLHPLDGGKILARFLPASINDKLEEHQNISGLLILVLVISGAIQFLAVPVEWMYQILISTALGVLT